MEKIIQFFRTVVIDAELQAKVLLTLLHVPIIVILVFLFKELVFLRRTNIYRYNLLFILNEFSVFCMEQYEAGMRVAGLARSGKPEDYEHHFTDLAKPASINDLLAKLVQNPEILLSQKVNLKVSSRLAVVADRVAWQHRFVKIYAADFLKEYKEGERKYFQHLSQLAMLHDTLGENMARNIQYNDDVKKWVTGYLTIFKDWIDNGACRGLARSYKELVRRIILLNNTHRNVPVAFNAHENAVRCEMIYARLSMMNADLDGKLNQFACFHRSAWKITTFVINGVIFRKGKVPGAITYTARKKIPSLGTQLQNRILDLNLKPIKFMGKRFLIYVAVLLTLLAAFVLVFITLKPSPARSAPPKVQSDSATKTGIQVNTAKQLEDTAFKKLAAVHVPAPDSSVYGIDISRYQGNLLDDFSNIDTLHFVLCKATEGVTYTDPLFASNFEFLQKKGLIRGAYHFYRNDDDALEQARHFLKTIGVYGADELPPVVDVEDGSLTTNTDVKKLHRRLLNVLGFIEKKIKRKPIIYTNLYFADEYLANDSFATYPLWLAEYSKGEKPMLPAAWKNKGQVIWQRSDRYTDDSRRVDFDIFNGTMGELRQFINRRKSSAGK